MIDRLTAVGAVLVVIVVAAVFLAFNPMVSVSQPGAPLAIQSVDGNRVLITNVGSVSFPKPNFLFNNETITANGGEVAANGTSTYVVNLRPFQLQNAAISIQGSTPDNQASPTVLITTGKNGGATQASGGQSNTPPSESGNGQNPQQSSNATANPPGSTQPPALPSSTGFVTASGTHLMLDGSEYRFVGVNVYGLASDGVYSCGPRPADQQAYLESLFSTLESMHVNAVRFWAFQSFSHDDFIAIDRVVNASKRHNIKLILTLENHWGDCTQGGEKTAACYANPNTAYGSYPLSYREYVQRIVTRYKDEPAILMWQLVNEAESRDASALLTFTRDMSQAVKSIDSNHLVSLGTLGTGQGGTSNENYVNLHSIPTIDVVEAHDYNSESQPLPGYPWNMDVNNIASIAADLAVSRQLNKPFFIGESAIANTFTNRVQLFDAKMTASFNNGTVGYLLWVFDLTRARGGTNCDGYDRYCFDEVDPLASLLSNHRI